MKRCVMLFIVITFLSCGNDDKIANEIRELHGRTIVFDKRECTRCYLSEISLDSLLSSDAKFVSYVDEFSCTVCAIDMLRKWTQCFDSIHSDVPYLVVCRVDESRIEDVYSELKNCELSCSILLLSSSNFMKRNNLDVMAYNRTFLLDRNNRIKVVGEPFNNVALRRLYRNVISKEKERRKVRKIA